MLAVCQTNQSTDASLWRDHQWNQNTQPPAVISQRKQTSRGTEGTKQKKTKKRCLYLQWVCFNETCEIPESGKRIPWRNSHHCLCSDDLLCQCNTLHIHSPVIHIILFSLTGQFIPAGVYLWFIKFKVRVELVYIIFSKQMNRLLQHHSWYVF